MIHEDIANNILPKLANELFEFNVEIRGDEKVCKLIDKAIQATNEDWETEYEDYIIAIKTVKNIEEEQTDHTAQKTSTEEH